jgi:hypothetical protein
MSWTTTPRHSINCRQALFSPILDKGVETMKRTLMAGAFLAMFAIVAVDASASDAAGPSPTAKEVAVLTQEGISTARAGEALALQGRVAQADLVASVEAALGGEFAGAWFEPAAATLHFGVTSAASKQEVARVVAQVGLTGQVVLTNVRSTWAQLVGAQSEWSTKLAELLAGGEAMSGLNAQRNALEIRLSSSISRSERAALERDAARADVNVIIAVVPTVPRVKREARACEFQQKIGAVPPGAFCENTITSGTGIWHTLGDECTAGPMLIAGNETYLLTAGHCFGKGELVKTETWVSKYPKTNFAEEKEIGNEIRSYNTLLLDTGEIKVKSGVWTNPLPAPVPALMAEWGGGIESDLAVRHEGEPFESQPHSVAGSRESVMNGVNCHEGGTSGEQCGKITATSVEGAGVMNLIEDSACGEPGDSGGPWFERSGGEVFMQGTHVGGEPSMLKLCNTLGLPVAGRISWYEPIKTILATFGGQELLTKFNESRNLFLPFRTPALKSCKLVLSGYKGLYTESKCETNTASGAWAWTTPGNGGKSTWYCLLAAAATQFYTEGLCQTTSASNAGSFYATLDQGQPFPKLVAAFDLGQILKSKVAGSEAVVNCSGGSSSLQPESGSSAGGGDLTYTGCTVTKPAKCEVSSPKATAGSILTESIRALQASATLVTLEPESAANFSELEFKNKGEEECALKGQKVALKGTQMCTWQTEVETPKLTHDFTCRASESSLKLGESSATYEGLVLARLSDDSVWKIK